MVLTDSGNLRMDHYGLDVWQLFVTYYKDIFLGYYLLTQYYFNICKLRPAGHVSQFFLWLVSSLSSFVF